MRELCGAPATTRDDNWQAVVGIGLATIDSLPPLPTQTISRDREQAASDFQTDQKLRGLVCSYKARYIYAARLRTIPYQAYLDNATYREGLERDLELSSLQSKSAPYSLTRTRPGLLLISTPSRSMLYGPHCTGSIGQQISF